MNPDQEFRENVLVILTDVQTKMNFLVGKDGTNGRVGTLETEVADLKQERARMWGAGAMLAILWTGALAIVEHFRK